MDKMHREVLNKVMMEIEKEEDRCGKLIVINNVEKNLGNSISSQDFEWALEHLIENCAIYRVKNEYVKRF